MWCTISLQERTRSALLETLYKDLQTKNSEYYVEPQCSPPPSAKSEPSGLFDTFKRAISGKVRSQSVDSQLAGASGKRPHSNGLTTAPLQLPPVGENDTTSSPLLRLVTIKHNAVWQSYIYIQAWMSPILHLPIFVHFAQKKKQ